MPAAVIITPPIRWLVRAELGQASELVDDAALDRIIRLATATDTQTYSYERIGTGEWRAVTPLYRRTVLTGFSFTGTDDHIYLAEADGSLRCWKRLTLSAGGTTTGATAAFTNSILTDSAGAFVTDGVVAGDVVFLTSRHAHAEVLARNSLTELFTDPLTGEQQYAAVDKDQTFRAGFAYVIGDASGTITDTADPKSITARPVNFRQVMVRVLEPLLTKRQASYDYSLDAGAIGGQASVSSVTALYERWMGVTVA